jgi:hypothetical protein
MRIGGPKHEALSRMSEHAAFQASRTALRMAELASYFCVSLGVRLGAQKIHELGACVLLPQTHQL